MVEGTKLPRQKPTRFSRRFDTIPACDKGVRRILVRGVNAALPPEAKKILTTK